MRAILRAVALVLILSAAVPAQQYTTCTPGTQGQINCGPQVASGKRIAIVGAAVAGTIIVVAILHHRKHRKEAHHELGAQHQASDPVPSTGHNPGR